MRAAFYDRHGSVICAVIYARCATANRNAIDEQVRLCRENAHSRGWIVVGVYSDLGASGNRMDNRPGLHRAITALYAGNILLVADLSRLARNESLLDRSIRDIQVRGVHVATADGCENALLWTDGSLRLFKSSAQRVSRGSACARRRARSMQVPEPSAAATLSDRTTSARYLSSPACRAESEWTESDTPKVMPSPGLTAQSLIQIPKLAPGSTVHRPGRRSPHASLAPTRLAKRLGIPARGGVVSGPPCITLKPTIMSSYIASSMCAELPSAPT